MKKTDFLVIALVLLLSISFYVIYFSNNYTTSDDYESEVIVYYKSSEVYRVTLKKNTNIRLRLTTKNKQFILEEDVNGDGIYDTQHDPKATTDSTEILNVIHIEYGNIHMEEANCKNKLCMNMRITSGMPTPIFCTNDVLIKIESKEFGIVIG